MQLPSTRNVVTPALYWLWLAGDGAVCWREWRGSGELRNRAAGHVCLWICERMCEAAVCRNEPVRRVKLEQGGGGGQREGSDSDHADGWAAYRSAPG